MHSFLLLRLLFLPFSLAPSIRTISPFIPQSIFTQEHFELAKQNQPTKTQRRNTSNKKHTHNTAPERPFRFKVEQVLSHLSTSIEASNRPLGTFSCSLSLYLRLSFFPIVSRPPGSPQATKQRKRGTRIPSFQQLVFAPTLSLPVCPETAHVRLARSQPEERWRVESFVIGIIIFPARCQFAPFGRWSSLVAHTLPQRNWLRLAFIPNVHSFFCVCWCCCCCCLLATVEFFRRHRAPVRSGCTIFSAPFASWHPFTDGWTSLTDESVIRAAGDRERAPCLGVAKRAIRFPPLQHKPQPERPTRNCGNSATALTYRAISCPSHRTGHSQAAGPRKVLWRSKVKDVQTL